LNARGRAGFPLDGGEPMARSTGAGSRESEDRLLAGLQEGPVRPVYVVWGRETFLVELCLARIRGRVLPPEDAGDVLTHVFHGSEARADDILNAARTPPFFHEKQLILVREAEKLKAAERAKLADYVDQPAEDSCVVFVGGEDLRKKNDLLVSAVEKRDPRACLELPPLKRERLRVWIQRIAQEKGVEAHISREVMAGFLDEGWIPLAVIQQRLEMLSLYLGGGAAPADPGALPAAWAGGALEKGYLLGEALVSGNVSESLILLHRFLQQGTVPYVLLARMSWEIRRIRALQEARRRGGGLEGVLGAHRIPPHKKGEYLALAARLPEKTVDGLFFSLMETDREMKSGRSNLQWPLEDLCLRIARIMRGG